MKSAANPGKTGLRGDRLAEAIAMLQRLPLSDAERAEAVRRMLGA